MPKNVSEESYEYNSTDKISFLMFENPKTADLETVLSSGNLMKTRVLLHTFPLVRDKRKLIILTIVDCLFM